MSEAAVSHYLAQYEQFRDTLTAPWLAQPRAAALDFLRTNGFPSRRTEQWKYTDVTPHHQEEIHRREVRIGSCR